MERKLVLLEQRLNLVEQFVEMRFCESYRDFILRNAIGDGDGKSGEQDDTFKLMDQFLGMRFCESFRDFTVRQLSSQSFAGGGGNGGDSRTLEKPLQNHQHKSSQDTSPTTTFNRTRQSKSDKPFVSRPTTRSSTAAAAATTTPKKQLTIRVIRLEDSQPATPSLKPGGGPGPTLIKVNSPKSPPPSTNLDEDNFEETSGGGHNDNPEDSYFTFPFEEAELDEAQAEVDGGDLQENEEDISAVDPNDQSWSDSETTSEDDDSDFKGKSPPSFSSSNYKQRRNKRVDLRRKCDERKFKCGYPPCTGAFYEKKHLTEHERMHQKDKWVACRVKTCGKLCVDNSKRLKHERRCILENLRKGIYVSLKVIEDVRKRSKLKEDPFKTIKEFPKLGEVDEEEEGVGEEDVKVVIRKRKGKAVEGGGGGGTGKKVKREKEPSYAYQEGMEGDIVNGDKKICPFCKSHWDADGDLFDEHVKSHLMERTFKCKICGKGFLNRKGRYKHERGHDKEKYGTRCRVGGGDEEWCKAIFTDKAKLLSHERGCVRRALEKRREVGKEVIEDVKRRSKGVILNWRGYDVGDEEVGRVKVCFVCKRWRGEEKEYEEHMEGHRNWGCGQCAGKFLCKKDLVRHVHRKHRGKKGEGEAIGGPEEEEEVRTAVEQEDGDDNEKSDNNASGDIEQKNVE